MTAMKMACRWHVKWLVGRKGKVGPLMPGVIHRELVITLRGSVSGHSDRWNRGNDFFR